MSTVPRPQLGRHVTSFTVVAQAVAADGTLSDSGSPVSILARHRSSSISIEPERVEINGSATTRRNEVVVSDGDSMTLSVFKVNNGTDPEPLLTLVQSTDYIKVAWVEGTATGSIATNTYIGVRGNYTSGQEGRGEQIAELQLGPADIGSAQFTRVIS